MEAVTGDPSLNSVSHEFEIEDGLSINGVPKEVRRGAFRTIARSRTLDGLVGCRYLLGAGSSTRSTS